MTGQAKAVWAVVAVLALACIVFLTLAPTANSYATRPYLNEIASELAGRDVSVRCVSRDEEMSNVVFAFYGASAYVPDADPSTYRWDAADFAVFDTASCRGLAAINRWQAYGVKARNLAWPILVLAHESGHMRGASWSPSEAQTQTWALHKFVWTAMRLGLDEPAARFLLRYAVEWHLGMPSQYRSAGCKRPTVSDAGLLEGCSWR